jgi:uncharacterized membrane protein
MEEQMRQAKRPVSIVAGPYGHPFHPILVTVPIGAWVAALVFDLVSLAADEPESWATGAYWLIGIGIVGALVAAMAGFLDLFAIPTSTKVFRIALVHMTINLVVVGLFAVSFLLRGGDTDEAVDPPVLALSVIALALLGVSGWLGGALSFRYGVRVVDETSQAEGFGSPSVPT